MEILGFKLDDALILFRFCGLVILVMLLIFLVTLLIPKIAKIIDKSIEKHNPERVEENPEEPKIKGPYDKSEIEDFDPNYKIYNTDIYSLKIKKKPNKERNVDNGKEQ
ncbi:MAG: hypothetical protein GX896_04290 [Clostridiales bacterium]|nr:hypothetical protein [Clostridiales bacterium]